MTNAPMVADGKEPGQRKGNFSEISGRQAVLSLHVRFRHQSALARACAPHRLILARKHRTGLRRRLPGGSSRASAARRRS